MSKRSKRRKIKYVVNKLRENPSGTMNTVKQVAVGGGGLLAAAMLAHTATKMAQNFAPAYAKWVGVGVNAAALGGAYWLTGRVGKEYRVALLAGIASALVLRLFGVLMSPKMISSSPSANAKAMPSNEYGTQVNTIEADDDLSDVEDSYKGYDAKAAWSY